MNKTQKGAVNPTKQHSMKCPKLYGKKCSCDGYHTFNELYEHRIRLWIALCAMTDRYFYAKKETTNIWRSKFHSDGSSFEGWFVLGMGKTKGYQLTYHLPISQWEHTSFAETLDKAPEFDGHTSEDVLERIARIYP